MKNQRHLCSRWLVSHQHLLPWNVGSAPENGPQAQSTDLQPHIPLFCCNDGGVVGRGVGSGWDPWDGRDRWLGSCANKIRHLNESNPSANVEYKNGLRRNVCVYSIRTRRFQFHIGPRVFPPIFKSLLMCGIWSRFSSLIRPLGCASFFTMEWKFNYLIWQALPVTGIKDDGCEHQIYSHTNNRKSDCHNIFYIEHDFDCTIEV